MTSKRSKSPVYDIKTSDGQNSARDDELVTVVVRPPDDEEVSTEEEDNNQVDSGRLATGGTRMEDMYSLADSDEEYQDEILEESDVDSELERRMNGVKHDFDSDQDETSHAVTRTDAMRPATPPSPEVQSDKITSDQLADRRKKKTKKKKKPVEEPIPRPASEPPKNRRKSAKKKVTPREEKCAEGKCPICNEVLDGRTRRVYTKHISTEVYFPFLEENHDELPRHGYIPKVKICFYCYEHLIKQWKEFAHAGIPHRRRRYRDRNGHKILSKKEQKRRAEMEHHIPTVEPASTDDEEPEPEPKEDPKDIDTMLDYDDQLKRLKHEMDQRDARLTEEMDSMRLGIERAIKKQGNRIKDEVACLKVENQLVRKNLVRMRREVQELRHEFGAEIQAIKKKTKKRKTREFTAKNADEV